MRFGALLASAALALGAVVVAAPAPAQSPPVDAADVQVLPRHLQEVPYPNRLLGASADYAMHNVHDVPVFDGHSHHTVLRTSDGSVAWSDFDASADASASALVGRFYVEKVGGSTYWPTSVRFFDVETQELAGEIVRPDSDTLFAIGPGWILTSRYGGDSQRIPGYFPVVHRLDGSSTELPDAEINRIPVYIGDGSNAWLREIYNDSLYELDADRGTVRLVPRPAGVSWSNVVVGPTRIFNLQHGSQGHVDVTAIERETGATATYDLVHAMSGNAPVFMALGDGLGAYHPASSLEGVLWSVDLAAGSIGPVLATGLSHALSMGNGKVAMVVAEKAPGGIAVHDGGVATTIAELPWVSESTGTIAYDGQVRATWADDTTWSIDPHSDEPAWSRTAWTSRQRVTTSGGTTLVNDLDENFRPTTRWRLTWPGGAREVEASSMKLGHGGQLLVRQLPDSSTYQVERVESGEVVATAGNSGIVADGSWVWTISSGVLTGVDVDHPEVPAQTVPTGKASAGLVDVRGRWALVITGGFTVIDTREVVAPWGFPYAQSQGYLSPPGLGAGFVVWSTWTYDAQHRVNGHKTTVTDLSPGHDSRQLVDPGYGEIPRRYSVDEAGSPSLAYIDKAGQPRILRLPWLQEAPLTLPDTAPPVLDSADLPAKLVRSSTPVTARFTWEYSDPGTAPSPSSGIASYAMRYRLRNVPEEFGRWASTTATSAASLTRVLQPGQEFCAQASATDAAGNTAAWSSLRCTQVDGAAPRLGQARGSRRFTIQDAYGGVWYRYSATDDHRVASYDVQARSAPPGAGLSPWRTLLHRTTDTLVRRPARSGSEWCFRFRARDRAGNVTAWSRARCSSLAIQETEFYSPADSTRQFSRQALDNYYRKLDYPGAWLRLSRPQVGSTLALWVMAGPGQGKADVYVGGVHTGRLSLTAKRWHRKLAVYRMPRSGSVKVVQRGWRPVGVDALAVER
jgi:hypothetical protein